ncbi:MAG: hypothetical protein WCJ64_01940 [Rhodospirillaceae bacterium]
MYNDLGHLEPHYLARNFSDNSYEECDEIAFHKANIYLLSLQFDHILICLDNVLSFTRTGQADLISKVVVSDWFRALVSAGVIVLCGWGARKSDDLVKNQIEYSLMYKGELKTSHYINDVRAISSAAKLIIREDADGEEDFIKFLMPKINRMRDCMVDHEFSDLCDVITHTQESVKYIGLMEVFPTVRKLFQQNEKAEMWFYVAYFRSFQEYSSKYYAPAVTVDTKRQNMPGRQSEILIGEHKESVTSSLYSPDFFRKYIEKRIGRHRVNKLLGIDVQKLLYIRNGDWKVFMDEYHRSLVTVSKIHWVAENALLSSFLLNDEIVDNTVNDIMALMHENNVDITNMLAIISGVIATTATPGPFLPIMLMFKDRILNVINSLRRSLNRKGGHTQAFINKLTCLLEGRYLILSEL